MRKLVAALVVILVLAASLPAGATYGTVFVRDWRNMAACQCLTDVWFVAPGAYARLSPDGKLMAYEVVDDRLYYATEYIGETGLFIGPRGLLMSHSWLSEEDLGPVYWAFPVQDYRWSKDGRFIYYQVMVDPSMVGVFWETWRLDLVTGNTEKMDWHGRVVMDTSPDGRWVILVQRLEDSKIEKVGPHYLLERNVIAVDLHSGREILLAERVMIRSGMYKAAISFNEQGDRLALPILDKVYLYAFDGETFEHYDTIQLSGLISAAVWDPHGDYLIVQRDTEYLRTSRFHDPEPKHELYWVDLRTKESGPLWPSNFSQYAPWFVPGTRTLAFNSQIGDTLQEFPASLVASGERLPPSSLTP